MEPFVVSAEQKRLKPLPQRRLKLNRLLFLSALALVGCAGQQLAPTLSPISGEEWQGRILSKNFTITREEARKQVLTEIGDMLKPVDTQLAENTIANQFPRAEKILNYYDTRTCNEKREILKQKTQKVANSFAEASYSRLTWNTATGVSQKARWHNSVMQTEDNGNLYTQQFSAVVKIPAGQAPTHDGLIKIDLLTEAQCEEGNSLKYKSMIGKFSINDPYLSLTGQRMAELSIKWDELRAIINSGLSKTYIIYDGEAAYKKALKSAVATLRRDIRIAENNRQETARNAIENRFSVRPKTKLESPERIYKNEINVLISRVQRYLQGSYKYDAKNTTYTIEDTRIFGPKTTELHMVVRFFPEEGGKTSVMYSIAYSPVYDNDTQKYVFSEADAKAFLKAQIAMFDKVLIRR